MGQSVRSQVDTDKYFAISQITAKILKEKGIKCNLTRFKEIVKKTPPKFEIITGENVGPRCKLTKIYAFEDFQNLA